MTNAPGQPQSAWTRKDLTGIQELSAAEIGAILDTASAFKTVGTREIKKVPALRGQTLVNFFVEASTRTRVSFELAAHRLSADVINVSAASSSLTKGETLKDTAKVFEANHADIIVLRHSSAGAAQFLAERLDASIINAGDGAHEHPTQALLDTFTIREKKGRIAGLHVAIVGDILFSRVARSNIHALLKLGARVTLVGPSTLVPRVFEEMGVTVTHDLDSVLPDVDVVNLLRIQHERQRKEYFPSLGEYTSLFGLTKARAERLKPDALIMHPGPINRGIEIDSDLADSGRSVILEQVTNGLAVRMAVLYLCAGVKLQKGMMRDNWPFDQPRNCATMTLRQIMSGKKPILMVSHVMDDHGWQFLDGENVSMKDAMLVCLQEVVEIDPSVLEIADLQPGWIATRKSANSSWQRELGSACSDQE